VSDSSAHHSPHSSVNETARRWQLPAFGGSAEDRERDAAAASATPGGPAKVPILGIPLALIDYDRTMDWIDATVSARGRGYVSAAAVHLVMVSQEDSGTRDAVLGCSLAVPDGQPLVWAMRSLGHDASRFDPDGPLPEIPESNASKSGRQRAIELAKREKLTVRQLAQRLGGYSGLAIVGTPATIADEMQEWLTTEASDGFTIMFPYLPGGLDDFVERVVPELQRRGLFRREYEGKTLRENLGLPRPANRFF